MMQFGVWILFYCEYETGFFAACSQLRPVK